MYLLIISEIVINKGVENLLKQLKWNVVGRSGVMCNFTPKSINTKVRPLNFWGNIEAKADAKGRLFIPAQFRKQLQSVSEQSLIMRKDVYQDCLILYPEEVWQSTLDELRGKLSKWNPKHQQVFRKFVSEVEIIYPDSSGRILIPKRYMQMVGIQSDVRFIGMDDKIEIWAKGAADKMLRETSDFGATLQEIMEGNNSGIDFIAN